MQTLSTELRRQLERTVIEARDAAEIGARGALEALAVQHHEPYGHMVAEQRTLRRRLRAHARQLGDRPDPRSGGHGIDRLVHECAYEHWHGMLFARFLAENNLLIEPEMGVAITLDECEELAKEEGVDKWTLAARFAHRMLPQVFRPDHPVFELQFAREHRLRLESLVEGLPADVFTATDSLGWGYQFWQTKKKEAVNRSEVKIGADELPAVTQLFTEPYMVQFLLHNSLGAWWASRHPDKVCPLNLTYLRKTGEGVPAVGSFEGWPDNLSEFRLLDPCCGSGHFLVAAFLMLVPMRIALEGLSAADAVDAVLRDNLHGLELDQRCVAIAAFALALEAWRYPVAGGFRKLPRLSLAWCGQPVAGKREQWMALAEGGERLEAGMAALYDTFRDAPVLGSLIDPTRSVSEDMLTAGFVEVQPLLEQALREHAGEEDLEETAIAALGLAEAARLLGVLYHLVITNVPYLTRGKQTAALCRFVDGRYPTAKNDLANVFLERCLELSLPSGSGVTQIVMPQNWLFLARYKGQRERLLQAVTWSFLVRLGSGAFETITGEVVKAILFTSVNSRPDVNNELHGIDASALATATRKAELLRSGVVVAVNQKLQLGNPDAVVSLENLSQEGLLKDFVSYSNGIQAGDSPRFTCRFWEIDDQRIWSKMQTPVNTSGEYGGLDSMLRWEVGRGSYWNYVTERLGDGGQKAWVRGTEFHGRKGIAVSATSKINAVLYCGSFWNDSLLVLTPHDESKVLPILSYCGSDEFEKEVRKVDQKLNVRSAVTKVPFDFARWARVANEKYPDGLPAPYSEDPTQWLFHGHPRPNESPLHVAIARLLGYRWPAEAIGDIELSDKACKWVEKAKALHSFEDTDGIVCIPSVRGEPTAHERLLQLLQAAWGDDWRDDTLTKLLVESGSTNLDDWLRNGFFEQHCKLFHHRPFIWHIWDGRKRDGFHALVNYHKLAEGDGKGRRLLESLTYSYLGDWISRQQDGVKRGEGGAEDRLAAALELQKRLVAILEGEPPFDLFVRWKPIEDQAIGWEPDINDGVRLNIRPFMAQDIPGGKKGAGILRAKPNIHWRKDRGKEPVRDQAQFPWFWENGKFTEERVNDVHLTVAQKRAARERTEGES